MRSSLAALVCAALLLTTTLARAQTGGSGGTGGGNALGSCTGMLAGSVGLSVPTSSGRQSVSVAQVPYVFDLPECECTPTDPNQQVNLEIRLTMALPISTAGTVEVWVGNGCDNYTVRTTPNQTACEKIAVPNITEFTTASTANGVIEIPIPGNKLTSPQPNGGTRSCTAAPTTSNSVYIFAYQNPMTPFAQCSLNLTEQLQGPTPVENLNPSPGDGRVTLNWMLPPQSSYTATQFQVLCSDDNGNPLTLPDLPKTALYSTCVNGVLQRRPNLTGGTIVGGGGPDGGTTVGDGGVSRYIPSGGYSQKIVLPEATMPDLAGTDMVSTDMAGLNAPDMANPVTFKPLASLDPKFACTDTIGATYTTATINGLTNHVKYHFVVLAIDRFGNATPSPAVEGTPQAVEDFYRRYRDENGAAGHCFIATAAFGSYESGWVRVLRDFRDQTLLPTELGRGFVDWYYEHSPPAAAWIAQRTWARAIVRLLLLPVIVLSALWLYTPPLVKALIILAAAAWLLRRRLAAAWRGAGA
jgi:hypothetical protein